MLSKNKPDTKGQMLYDSIYMRYPEWAASQRQKVLKRLGKGNRSYYLTGTEFVWDNKKVLEQIVGMVNFMLCIFHHNKKEICSDLQTQPFQSQGLGQGSQAQLIFARYGVSQDSSPGTRGFRGLHLPRWRWLLASPLTLLSACGLSVTQTACALQDSWVLREKAEAPVHLGPGL